MNFAATIVIGLGLSATSSELLQGFADALSWQSKACRRDGNCTAEGGLGNPEKVPDHALL